ncbi:MAG: hemolysin III family protein [Bacteroidetes bacterium]|nr:hemolysin III family protein [Bacteroidota bacterium]MBS1539636.1 hemolysin III family protein [Bacteroidota bacterium]
MKNYIQKEERVNWITHAIALGLSLVGAVFIYRSLAQHEAKALKWVSSTVYAVSLIILYSASTGYHAMVRAKWKQLLRLADHIAIYVKIAGTYTPFLLLALPFRQAIVWLVLLWTLVIAGTVFKIFLIKKVPILSTILYVAMGWLAVFIFPQLYSSLPGTILACIVAGGIFFTAGVFFFVARKIPFSHSIWHVFVMAGSGWHYAGVYLLISR